MKLSFPPAFFYAALAAFIPIVALQRLLIATRDTSHFSGGDAVFLTAPGIALNPSIFYKIPIEPGETQSAPASFNIHL